MKKQATYLVLLASALLILCASAQAATWQICRLELHITDVLKKPFPQLQAEVLTASPKSATVECPKVGTTLTFTPETADYQATLPRRQWPRKGQSVQVDYRYLDGICKGDGKNYACRIEHYPFGR